MESQDSCAHAKLLHLAITLRSIRKKKKRGRRKTICVSVFILKVVYSIASLVFHGFSTFTGITSISCRQWLVWVQLKVSASVVVLRLPQHTLRPAAASVRIAKIGRKPEQH